MTKLRKRACQNIPDHWQQAETKVMIAGIGCNFEKIFNGSANHRRQTGITGTGQ
jgi:hypothetical protein